MPTKEELLKQLIESLSEEDIEKLVSGSKEDTGPRTSKISNKVLDNSGFESMREEIDQYIPSREAEYIKKEQTGYIDRNIIPRRDPIKLVNASCHRCGTQKRVPATHINTKVDDQMVYLCPECSTKRRS